MLKKNIGDVVFIVNFGGGMRDLEAWWGVPTWTTPNTRF